MKDFTVTNCQLITIREQSNSVTVTENNVKELRKFEEFSFDGESEEEFLHYLTSLFEQVDNEELDFFNLPEIAQKLYNELRADVARTEVWSSLQKSNDSVLIAEREDSSVASVGFFM
jgi:hypothetical protein